MGLRDDDVTGWCARQIGRHEASMIAAMEEVVSKSRTRAHGPLVARLAGVSKNYGDIRALRNINLGVHAGEVVAVLGPNGAGKTTAVKLLLGLAGADAGTVTVFGGDPRDPENRMRTGAMLQVGRVPETLRVREHIDLFSSYYPSPLPLAKTICAAGLEGLEQRPFGQLSGGQKQRLLFALAICGDPDLLFLDEPTVGMDVEARRILWDQIRHLGARGKTVLLTTHYLEEADALADCVVVINQGSVIAEGTPEEIKGRTAGRQVRCVTSLPIATVCSIPGVQDARSDRGALLMHTMNAEAVVRDLLLRDPHLRDLEVSSGGLEEAFLALTQNDDKQASSRPEVIR
jgi:ABC-2 type transport system ATP-binding protein